VALTLLAAFVLSVQGFAQGTGTVVGAIKFTEEIPKMDKLLIDRDTNICGVTKPGISFQIPAATKGIKNVVLSVEGVPGTHKPKLENLNAQIVQDECMFLPHVQVVPVGTTLEIKNDGLISVKCDVHIWMSAFIVVKDHPFWAVSAEDGTCRIENVPVGQYKLNVWHEELGTIERDITVTAGKETTLDFDIGS